MRKSGLPAVCLVFVVLLASGPAEAGILRAPVSFEPIRGRSDSRVRYVGRGFDYGVFVMDRETLLALGPASQGPVVRVRLAGASPVTVIEPVDALPGKSHCYVGSDPRKWRAHVPGYGKLEVRDVYAGIDLVYHGHDRQLEYDFVVAPGADHRRIEIVFEGVDHLALDATGDLVLRAAGTEFRLSRPVVYQEWKGSRHEVAGGYVLAGSRSVRFRGADYDRGRPLIIDPILAFSTFLGGGGSDSGQSVAVDADGNAYVTGSTSSSDFNTATPGQPSLAGYSDVFVSKFDSTGRLVYSTYLGGQGDDHGHGIAVDGSGNAYVTGETYSNTPPLTDFPITYCFPHLRPKDPCPFQSEPGGLTDAFVAKLDATGTLIYSTFLGGTQDDVGRAIAVDRAGNAHVAGSTQSANFPRKNAFQPDFGGERDAFVAKLNADGSDLVFATFLGGTRREEAVGIAVRSFPDPAAIPCCPIISFAYVTGWTESPGFPTTAGAFLRDFHQGVATGLTTDAFVTGLGSAGSLLHSTFIGGSGEDAGLAIAVDGGGSAYVTGTTSSTDFPVREAFQAGYGGEPSDPRRIQDAFVARLNPAGSELLWSTYFGADADAVGEAIAVDPSGAVQVAGTTHAARLPAVRPFQDAFAGSGRPDAFVARFDPSGMPSYSSHLGHLRGDSRHGIGVDAEGHAYVVGETTSSGFPTTPGALDRDCGADAYCDEGAANPVSDAFVTRVDGPRSGNADLAVNQSASPNPVLPGEELTYTITVANHGPDRAEAVTVIDRLSPMVRLSAVTPSDRCAQSGKTVVCRLGSLSTGATTTVQIVVTVNGAPILGPSPPPPGCAVARNIPPRRPVPRFRCVLALSHPPARCS